MIKKTLGKTTLSVSEICLGCSVIKESLINDYFELGGNFLDTSPSYTDSESAIANFGHRKDLIIGTKVGLCPDHLGLSKCSITQSLEQSLKRLKTDYVDILWLHIWDFDQKITEVCDTLLNIKKEGKCRYIGASNIPAWIVAQSGVFDLIQTELNICNATSKIELIPMAKHNDLGILGRSIFGKGYIFGNTINSWSSDKNHQKLSEIRKIVDPSHFTLQWLKKENVTPIVRTKCKSHLIQNINYMNSELNAIVMNLCEQIIYQDIPMICPYNTLYCQSVRSLLNDKTPFYLDHQR